MFHWNIHSLPSFISSCIPCSVSFDYFSTYQQKSPIATGASVKRVMQSRKLKLFIKHGPRRDNKTRSSVGRRGESISVAARLPRPFCCIQPRSRTLTQVFEVYRWCVTGAMVSSVGTHRCRMWTVGTRRALAHSESHHRCGVDSFDRVVTRAADALSTGCFWCRGGEKSRRLRAVGRSGRASSVRAKIFPISRNRKLDRRCATSLRKENTSPSRSSENSLLNSTEWGREIKWRFKHLHFLSISHC